MRTNIKVEKIQKKSDISGIPSSCDIHYDEKEIMKIEDLDVSDLTVACLKRNTVLFVQSIDFTFSCSVPETPPPLYPQVKEAAYHQLQVATGDLKKSLKNCSEEAGRIVRSIGEFVAVQDVLKSIHKVAHPEHERRTPPTVYTQHSGTKPHHLINNCNSQVQKPHYLLNHSQLSSTARNKTSSSSQSYCQLSSTPMTISLACSLLPMSSP